MSRLRNIAILAALASRPASAGAAAPPSETVERSDPSPEWGHNWVWAEATCGYDFVAVQRVRADLATRTFGTESHKSGGPSLGVALGARFRFITLGLRASTTNLGRAMHAEGRAGWLWRVGPELGLRVAAGRLDLHLSLGGGYATRGNGGDVWRGLEDGFGRNLAFDGLFLSARVGVHVFLAEALSVGLTVVGDAMLLGRPGTPIGDLMRKMDGTTYGGAVGTIFSARIHL